MFVTWCKGKKDTIPSLRVRRLSLEVGGDEVNDLPHAVPSGGLRLCYRAIDHGRQRDGRVVAPEAGQDVLATIRISSRPSASS